MKIVVIESYSRVYVAEARGQFGKPEEGERPLLEAIIRRLVKTKTDDASVSVTVFCEVQSQVMFLRAHTM
jgi:hypothetical protein